MARMPHGSPVVGSSVETFWRRDANFSLLAVTANFSLLAVAAQADGHEVNLARPEERTL
jgi:hypothetical protein